VRELLELKLIESIGYSTSIMGRPKQLLQLNANGREAIGIQIEPHKISGGLVNLSGQVKTKTSALLLPTDSQDVLFNKLKSIVEKLLTKASKKTLLGIGLATHGIIDKKTGVVLQSARFPGWLGVNISDFFKEHFKMNVSYEDNTRCKAIAEHWIGAARNIEDFVLLDLGYGIGCSIVNGGNLLSGITNTAGELGHNVIVFDGKACRCGMKGCLEAMAAIPSIEEAFSEQFPEYANSSFKEICTLAEQGHRGAISVIEDAGGYIGIATSSIVNVLNPGYLIICGELMSAGSIVENAIKKGIESHAIPSSYKALNIINGKSGDDGAIIGAGMLVLGKVFNPA
jgi:predicted NBD/HSP70 family sugar kinase